jgi:hypothetical protein
MSNTLDGLLHTLETSDFGIFVFSPEDLVTIRNQQSLATRDNVVFELGLFIGRLGKKRSFFVLPRDQENFRLPTDLIGVTPATFDPDRTNLQAALGPACNQIRNAINQWVEHDLLNKLSGRLIYLLRNMAEINDFRTPEDFGSVLRAYEKDTRVPLSEGEWSAWYQAAEYACQYLYSIQLVKRQVGLGTRVAITDLGRFLVRSKAVQKEFRQSFDKALILGGNHTA